MRPFLLLLSSFTLLHSSFSQDGFTSLFNGKDLAGWDGDPALWKVEDGVVIGTNPAPEAMANNSFLIWRGGTVKTFAGKPLCSCCRTTRAMKRSST